MKPEKRKTLMHAATFLSLTVLLLSSVATVGMAAYSKEANALTAEQCNNLTIPGIMASGYADNARKTENAIDNNLDTRWSNDGKGSWLRLDLGEKKIVCYIDIAWYKGDGRINNFVVSVSSDGAAFTNVFSGKSSGNTNAFERYNFADIETRYVKVTVNGNQWNDWASISEVDVYGDDSGTSTPPPSSDLTIDFANVDEDQVLSGTYKVVVSASDPSIVSNIKLYVDSTLVKQENVVPYEFNTDTTKFSDGSHVLKAVATDKSGNTVTKTVAVSIKNQAAPPPSPSGLTISFANVAENQVLSGIYKVVVSASDPTKVSNIKLYVDAALIKQENATPYEFSTDTTKFSDGNHVLKAVALDKSGGTLTKTVTAEFDNQATTPPPAPGDLLTPPAFKKKWAGTGSFDEPSSLDHDTAGNLWISPHDNKLEKHTFDGQVIKVVTNGFSHPHGIAIDRERGNIIYAGDQGNKRIQVFDNDGNFIKYINNPDMPHIHDIGYDKATGAIYAPDYEADHLQKINPSTGAVIWKKTGLPGAWGVYTDSKGYIYLAVTNAQELHKLDPSNGNTIKKVGGFSGGQGITGVYVDQHDLVYVLDAPKDQVQVYDTELNKLATWNLATITGGITKPEDITISDDDKNIYIADSDGKFIYWLQRQ